MSHNWTFFTRCFRFVTIHAFDGQADGRTDKQTESRQQYRAYALQSHGKSVKLLEMTVEWSLQDVSAVWACYLSVCYVQCERVICLSVVCSCTLTSSRTSRLPLVLHLLQQYSAWQPSMPSSVGSTRGLSRNSKCLFPLNWFRSVQSRIHNL